MSSPLVTHVRRLSMDDGPGLRTVVFVKGCPLRCAWCHNPENLSPEPELMLRAETCRGFGECVVACPEDALSFGRPPVLDATACTQCWQCVDACPTGAWRRVGHAYEADELADLVLRDRPYFDSSGGGVTFSGGEPTMFPAFVGGVLRRLHDAGVHTAIETAGTFAWATFARELLPHVDLVLYDLKLFDDVAHRRHTGAGNARILRNFVKLCEEESVEVVPRTPLVPGITATVHNLDAIRRFVADRRCEPLVLLPYNPAGESKRRALVA